MLLGEERLFSLGEKQRLPAILADSRKYQNVVSTKLAEHVLAALFELVRGFQAANDQAKGELLRDVLASDPNHVYHGLLTVLMRPVFILYAEDRGLLSNDRVYVNYYAVTGLFDRLRADAGRFPDTMDLRYGAWAQLLTLFRLVYEGGRHGGLHIPARQGYLFDPRRYPFLEASALGGPHDIEDVVRTTLPRVTDGIVFRVLNHLLILDGERLSYRTLDVERYKWPGQAAVVVSVVHVGRSVGWSEPPKGEAHHERDSTPVGLTTSRTSFGPPYVLDRREVPIITAYLFHAGGHDDPHPLRANAGKSFQASIVLGMGFTFDDTDIKGVASPIAEMQRLIAKDPRNAERIFPHIGGEEVNDSPTHSHPPRRPCRSDASPPRSGRGSPRTTSRRSDPRHLSRR
jgi:hypothetical protein